MTTSAVLPHNAKPAATWNAGGKEYDEISATIADAIEHGILRLAPKRGERILDVATGTGWTARRLAAHGANVTGMDLGSDLIAAATAMARDAGYTIDFKVGDAESLEFPDAAFDAVVSTFGVMFVSRPEAAAAELGRVVKKGGRLALVTWPSNSTVADIFKVMKPYMPPNPTPPPSPFEWGKPDRVRELLGKDFDLKFETGVTTLRRKSGAEVWDLFVTGYGPTKTLAGNLEPERREALKRDFIALHERYPTELGLAMPREYLVVIGQRK